MILFRIIRIIFVLICVALFVWQMYEIGEKFRIRNMVSVATHEKQRDAMKLPLVTLCPFQGFHSPGRFFPEAEFVEKTINIDSLVKMGWFNGTMGENPNLWNITQIRSHRLGTCYTIEYKKTLMQTGPAEGGFTLPTHKQHTIDVYLHEPGNEVWFALGKIKHLGTARLDVLNNWWKGFVLALSKEVHIMSPDHHIGMESTSCDLDQNDDDATKHNTCVKKAITEELKANLNCTVAYMSYFDLHPLEPCSTFEQAFETFETYINITDTIVDNPSAYGCPVPCKRVDYKVALDILHATKLPGSPPPNTCFVEIFYESLKVKAFVEYPVYDRTDMMMSVGGILALFMGFSVLSLLLDCTDFVQKLFGVEEHLKTLSMCRRSLHQ